MSGTCESCRFADPAVGDDGNPYVMCRRYPPQLFVFDDGPAQSHPSVSSHDWCGEWAAELEGSD